ncbi:PDR/VanB family oxidoreductase [Actinomadura sp. 9N407]|uniref:PDR/VanB family oxidoreductase n=1 Tax=Actinomadura sp. 9N407 TaxID=3375154 RepID=UPI003791C750
MIPPDLRGRRARDPFWVTVNAVFNGIQRMHSIRKPVVPYVRPVDRTFPLVVREMRPEAEGVVSVRLSAPESGVLPRWQPGAHLDVRLPSGRRRQYSLCGDPEDRRAYRIAVRRIPDGGGGSAEIHDELAEGATIVGDGPRNAFPFLARERYLFIAGGIGITPILPMVKAAQKMGADWRLVYAGRSRASLPFLEELPSERVTVRTDDEHGVPEPADLLGGAAGAAVYCCGPAPMIDGVRAAFVPDGSSLHAEGTLHYERFAPPAVSGEPFEVELRRSGLTLEVPGDRSALDVIRDALPDVPYSCRQGFCGTCRTGLLDGEADDPGGDSMLICVSRSKGGRLTLDL